MKKSAIAVVCTAAAVLLSACSGADTTKSGVVTGLEQFSISITAGDGTVYRYAMDGETRVDEQAETLGDTVEISSKGKYQDGVHADEIKLVKEAEDAPVQVEAVYGKVTDAANASVTISANNKTSYTILKDDNTVVHSGNGIAVGDYIEVVYTGSLDDGTALAQSILVTNEHEVKAAPTPAPKAGKQQPPADKPKATPNPDAIWYLTGECVDHTMNSVVIRYKGTTYSVVKDDSTVVVGDIQIGDTIRVFHKGSLESGMRATKIALISKASGTNPADFETRTLSGTIKDAANASLVLATRDGKEVHVVKNDSTKVTADISVGASVEVTYSAVAEDGSPIALEIK